MDWLAFVGSILGGLIGGLFTFIGVKTTLRHDDERKRKEELEKQYAERPRLEIISYKDIKPVSTRGKFDCDCILIGYQSIFLKDDDLHFSYDEGVGDLKSLCCVEYIFRNIGKTEIDGVCFVCNQKDKVSLVSRKEIEFYSEHDLPSCEVWCNKRFIKEGDTFALRICYLKDKMVLPYLSAVVSIHIQDINGNVWHQPLFCPSKETDNSTRENYKVFREYRDMESTSKYIESILRREEIKSK